MFLVVTFFFTTSFQNFKKKFIHSDIDSQSYGDHNLVLPHNLEKLSCTLCKT